MSGPRERDRMAHIALTRFGMGAKPGGLRRIADDPRGALLEELSTRSVSRIPGRGLPSYKEACRIVHTSFEAENDLCQRELEARMRKHLEPEIGFVERLVIFFSNHFSMSINKDGAVRATIGQLERDVIRAHVQGKFPDMLLGVMQHPAMMEYLDNASSIGPNSSVGLSWGAGMNENLGRELLELHTLGVGGGYTQADVQALTRILTGWSYVRGWEARHGWNGGRRGNRGQFIFRADWHEPGSHRLLGRNFGASGQSKGRAALRMLALHPSTAEFLAFKLVRHFITDTPTQAMVDRVARAYTRSDGDLRATARALINLPEAWSLPLTKLRTPYEVQIAQMRAMNRFYPERLRWAWREPLRALRNLPWERGPPDGYSDDTAYWISPDAVRIRAETAHTNVWALLEFRGWRGNPQALARSLFGKALSRPSRDALAQITNQRQGLATLFQLPEFQRR
ncbi:MAG: DUF1800 family protein [Roseinatronobacter sp.]